MEVFKALELKQGNVLPAFQRVSAHRLVVLADDEHEVGLHDVSRTPQGADVFGRARIFDADAEEPPPALRKNHIRILLFAFAMLHNS